MSDISLETEQITQSPLPNFLDGLNNKQLQAVQHVGMPLLVLAGAGTGKTRVLISRIAWLLSQGYAFDHQIMAVTFTNRAAREIGYRLSAVIQCDVSRMWLGTFHSLCMRLLRRHPQEAGLESGFTALGDDDQKSLVKNISREMEIDEKKLPPAAILRQIDDWKNYGWHPEHVPEERLTSKIARQVFEIYKEYQNRLQSMNAVDFGDMILRVVSMLQYHPELLAQYRNRFQHILVDEYQDTNVTQYLLLRLLAQKSSGICCVGDDDQSIYGWRGAEVDNILRFEEDFDMAKVIRLEQNYRSTGHILAVASGIIDHNRARLGKRLWTDGDDGRHVVVRITSDGYEEARFVLAMINKAIIEQNMSLDKIAILVRSSAQMRLFEEQFLKAAIAYRVIGGPKFYNRAEVRDIIAYLRLICQTRDDLAFERILNVPKRGLGAASLQKIHITARQHGSSLWDAAHLLVGQTGKSALLSAKARVSVAAFLSQIQVWQSRLGEKDMMHFVRTVIEESGYRAMLEANATIESQGRLENLDELGRSMADFDCLTDFLEYVAIASDMIGQEDEGQKTTAVSLMTIHAAKGLEFDTVFLPGWEEGLFPHQRSLDDGTQKSLEEERRLAYVALTRARKAVYICSARNRLLYNRWQEVMPSRFLDELPGKHILRDNGFSGFGYHRR